jgi:hypothetical protein
MATIICTGFSEQMDEERAKKSVSVSILKNPLIGLIWPSWFGRCWTKNDAGWSIFKLLIVKSEV